MVKFFKNQKGFSLLEIAMVVAIMAITLAFGMPVFNSFQKSNDLDVSRNNIVHSLRRAQILARSMSEDTEWGVYVDSSAATIFRGNSFVSRDTDFDESIDLPSIKNVSGINEVIFQKLTGNTTNTGSIIISNGNKTQTININLQGTVSY